VVAEIWAYMGSHVSARFEDEMINKFDTHFYVASVHQYHSRVVLFPALEEHGFIRVTF
jgi:hydrogenase maturation factor HypE